MGSRHDLIKLWNTAVAAAEAAGRALMRHFQTRLQVKKKRNGGLVTLADFEAERAAVWVLRREYPDFDILSEETEFDRSGSPGRWILDPLDGTTNFARGFGHFCVSLAAEWNGEVLVGVVYQPVTGDQFVALRGQGAFVNGRRMGVSDTKRIKDAVLTTGFSSEKNLWFSSEIQAFGRLSLTANAVRRPGSAALDLANVARGVFDGFWERGLAHWDVAAGALLVEEAGGTITDFRGRDLRPEAREILASNGTLHRTLIRELESSRRAVDKTVLEK